MGFSKAAKPTSVATDRELCVEFSAGQLERREAIPTANRVQAIALRPYQVRAVDDIRAAFRIAFSVLMVSPTGSGKTLVFAYVVTSATAKRKRVLVLAHRQEIVDQISMALTDMGVTHGVIAAGHPSTDAPVQIASVATLSRRLSQGIESFDLIVIDEAHHAVAGSWQRIISAMPDSYMLGVTATPQRLDGRGLGAMFDKMVIGPGTAELIAAGYLSQFTVYAPDRAPDLSGIRTRAGDYAAEQLAKVMSQGGLVGDAVEHYGKLCAGKSAIAFCVDIAHSRAVAERFTAAGFRAAHVDGETPSDRRRALIAALGAGELDVLTNCGLISEGVDVPAIGAAIMMRPTQSLALYLQMVGRVLRPAPGKAEAIILDHAGNALRHGLPDAPRTWSLDDLPRHQRGPGDAGSRLRHCACGALAPAGTANCTACGAELRPGPVEQREIAAELVRIEREEDATLDRMSFRQLIDWAGDSPDRLRRVARIRGYRSGWVAHRLRELADGVAAS